MDAPERFSSADNKAIQQGEQQTSNVTTTGSNNDAVVATRLGATPNIRVGGGQCPLVVHNDTQGPE